MRKNKKGATLGIVIVLILFLSMIAFLVMSMATIVSFTVIKNEKLADAEIRLQIEAQEYLNKLTKVTYETYYDVEVNGDNYLTKLTPKVTSIKKEEYEATYDVEKRVFTFILKDETINKTLTVKVMFYVYGDVNVNKANPFYMILCWESKSIKVENPGGE